MIGAAIFFIAWLGYVIIRISCLKNELLRSIVLVILILAVLLQAYFAIKNVLLEREIKKDPQLKDALNNELVQLNELKAWRVSFFSVIGFIVVAAIVSIFVQINDMMLIYIRCEDFISTAIFLDSVKC